MIVLVPIYSIYIYIYIYIRIISVIYRLALFSEFNATIFNVKRCAGRELGKKGVEQDRLTCDGRSEPAEPNCLKPWSCCIKNANVAPAHCTVNTRLDGDVYCRILEYPDKLGHYAYSSTHAYDRSWTTVRAYITGSYFDPDKSICINVNTVLVPILRPVLNYGQNVAVPKLTVKQGLYCIL